MKHVILVFLFVFVYANSFSQDDFDRIFLLNRTEIKAKIEEVGTFEIGYFELGAPEIKKSIRISAVWKVINADGQEQVYNEPLPLEIVGKNESETVVESSAVVAVSDLEKDSASGASEDKEKFSLKDINFYVDNRPIYAIRVGFGPQIISDERAWVSTIASDGLGFRFGVAAELGFEFNFHQLFGISLTSGITTATTNLDYLDGESTLVKDKLKLMTIPTTLKAKFYPMDGLSISGGVVFNSLSLTGIDPIIDKSTKPGYTFGLSRLAPIGRGKNIFEIGINYTKVRLDRPVDFRLDSVEDGTTLMGPFTLDKLGYVTLTFAYQFGIFTK